VAGEVLSSEGGVSGARVDYFTGTAEVTYDMAATSVDMLDALVKPLGYGLSPLTDASRTSVSRRDTLAFLLVAILTMNVMSLAFLRYFLHLGYLDHLPPFIPWIEGALTLPILYLGWLPTVRRAMEALFHRRLTMDLLIAIGVGAAATLSAISLATGREDMYFETAAGLTAISLLSRMIEARLRERAFSELVALMKMPVKKVRQLDASGAEQYVDIAEVSAGDTVHLLKGELVPVDGEVLSGEAVVSEAVLTGEPQPLAKHPGDPVVAGSSLVEGALALSVVRRFDETLLSQMARSIGETLARQEGRLRQADRIASFFIPAVMVVALGAWLARLGLHGWRYALTPAGWFPSIAVLAVACPCAFSLAGISAVTAATGALLKRGMLVKELRALDALHRVDHVVFDKTGTLTKGTMTVDRLIWRDASEQDLLGVLLSAEQHAGHPAALAIRAYLLEQGVSTADDPKEKISDIQGQGRTLERGDKTLSVGCAELFDDPFDPPDIAPNHTAVWFGWDRQAAGCFLLLDEIRESAADAVASLNALNITSELVSGDRDEVTQHVAKAVGIPKATGHAAIADKIELVKARRAAGKTVAFVGDGTNDALAMGEAQVSVALAKSTDEALAASGLVALRGNVANLADIFTIGRKLRRVMTQNYVWAFAFNTLFIPIAAMGKLVPLAAMLLMLTSSITVLLNAMRLRGGSS
jgi:heavy metal translocating P-type ATPase